MKIAKNTRTVIPDVSNRESSVFLFSSVSRTGFRVKPGMTDSGVYFRTMIRDEIIPCLPRWQMLPLTPTLSHRERE